MRALLLPPSSYAFRGIVLAVLVAVAVVLVSPDSPAFAQSEPAASVSVDPLLARVGSLPRVTLTGQLGGPWPAAVADVTVRGPGDPAADPQSLPVAARVQQQVGDLNGSFQVSVSLQGAEGLGRGGAYWVSSRLTSGADKALEAGGSWMGLAPAGASVDLATVWPVAYGIHQAPDGAFVDQVLESAVLPRPEADDSLYRLFQLADRFSSWRLSLAVEPVLLTQLRDMSDGYVSRLPGEGEREVAEGEQGAELAGQALDAFASVVAVDGVEVVAAPYALPSLPLLAAEGWDDGREQMQLGKTLLQEILSLPRTLDGGYPPAADLTTDSLGALGQASVDYAVAGPDVAVDLVERPDGAQRPVRVRDQANNRVTLAFADPGLRVALAPPWDAGRFFAALASAMTANPAGPFIAVPASDYDQPPAAFLTALGEGLESAPFVQTRTLGEVVERYPASTRPVFLTRYGGDAEGFVGRSYQERLRRVRGLVGDLQGATESDRAPLNEILLTLYQGQSRYWFAPGTDPRVANLGVSYLDHTEQLVNDELDKLDVAGDKSVIMMGGAGEVPVAVVNQTGYPLRIRLSLEPSGLTLEGDSEMLVELGPQENIFQVPVDVGGGSASLDVRIFVGDTEVDAETISVRSLSLGTILPWAFGIVAVLVLGTVLFVRFR